MSLIELRSSTVWATQATVAGNPVQQMLVPAGKLTVDPLATGGCARSRLGSWPTTALSTGDHPLSLRVTPTLNASSRAEWVGDRSLLDPGQVVLSWESALTIRTPGTEGALRRPQAGALHAVLGHLLSGVGAPGLVVMPTGTGKTETMLAVTVAAGIERLLVVVPSVDLRDQTRDKFLRLGVLQKLGIVSPDALRPTVGSLQHGLHAADEAAELLRCAHVVVATPDALHATAVDAREALLDGFTHLMVDEAHHAPARTWREVVDAFHGRPVLLFTATPYREDGLALPGRSIYRFPLREAQKDGYFKPIDYKGVVNLADPDRAVAEEAIRRLREDLRDGYDHVLMARVASIARTKERVR
jgi:superfamily II DNA or RNA helicase